MKKWASQQTACRFDAEAATTHQGGRTLLRRSLLFYRVLFDVVVSSAPVGLFLCVEGDGQLERVGIVVNQLYPGDIVTVPKRDDGPLSLGDQAWQCVTDGGFTGCQAGYQSLQRPG